MNTDTPSILPKLGIFDSGVGGFSVLKEVRNKTSADVLYFGDCARAPYGNRSPDEIVIFIEEIIANLQSQEVTHFVSACNSMSVMTTDRMLKECNVSSDRYIDMLRAFKEYSSFSNEDQILIIGTHATITSGAYQEVLKEKKVTSHEYIFKTLAGVIEKDGNEDELYEIIMMGINYAKEKQASHILYGCTHYPLVDNIFKKCAKDAGWGGAFIDPAVYVAEAVSKWNLEGKKNTFFEASEITKAFKELSDKYIK